MADPRSVQAAEAMARESQNANTARARGEVPASGLAAQEARAAEVEATVGVDAEIDGGAEDAAPTAPRAEPTTPQRPTLRVRPDPRDEIVRRIRADRDRDAERTAEVPIDDLRDATDLYVPEEYRARRAQPEPETIEPEPTATVEPGPAVAPAKRKLKVRGQERELTQDEIDEAARKFLAGDSYLEDSRATADRARALLDDIEQRARRTPAAGEPHAAPQPASPAGTPTQTGEPPADPYVELVRSLQFGDDPEEAATRARELFTAVAAERAREIVQDERLRDEVNRSQKVLDRFKSEHHDFFSNPMIEAAAERRVYDLMAEDLRGIGVKDDQMPNPNAIAGLHLRMRAGRQNVRDVETIFGAAKADVEALLTGRPAPADAEDDATPASVPAVAVRPQQQPAAPGVNLSPTRTARRMAIPQQPTRTAPVRAPTTPVAPVAPQPRDPSDTIRQMAEARKPIAHNAK
jgi:hypothetical protein